MGTCLSDFLLAVRCFHLKFITAKWFYIKERKRTSWLLIDLLKGDELELSGSISTFWVSGCSIQKH